MAGAAGHHGLLKLNLIAACDSKMGIGVKNDLPWKLKNEMAYFNRMTTGGVKDPGSDSGNKRNVVLMGRKTYESIPTKFRPLKHRLNVVLGKTIEIKDNADAISFKSWEEAMDYLSKPEVRQDTHKIWVIGGSHIYQTAIKSPLCHRIYLTKILQEFPCDTFFPQFNEDEYKFVEDPEVPSGEQVEGDVRYTFNVYEKVEK